MKNLAIILFAALAVASCKNRASTSKESVGNAIETAVATRSLDVAGTYVGTTPCADCQGINVTITLDNDGNFTRKMKYLNDREGNNEFTDKGTYTVEKNGAVLKLGDTMYRVGPTDLTVLDEDGNVIEGELAELYVLTRQLEGMPTEDHIDRETEKLGDEAVAKRRTAAASK